MVHQININPEALAKEALEQNPVLYKKISVACQVEETEVPDLLGQVMIFLSLIAIVNERLTPSIIVDNAWHELILCTKYYHTLCERNFGRYIHHHPGGKEEDNRKQFANTIKRYQQHYGTPPSKYWGHIEVATNSDCGWCSAYE